MHGKVPSKKAEQRLVRLAKEVKGVKSVKSNLTIEPKKKSSETKKKRLLKRESLKRDITEKSLFLFFVDCNREIPVDGRHRFLWIT